MKNLGTYIFVNPTQSGVRLHAVNRISIEAKQCSHEEIMAIAERMNQRKDFEDKLLAKALRAGNYVLASSVY